MESFNSFLKQFPHYTKEAYEDVLPYLSYLTLEADEYFLEHKKICRRIAFIESGMFRLYYLNDGKEVTNCFCLENSISTSYSSLIMQAESDIAIQAIEASKLIILSYESLQELYEKSLFWQQVGRIAAESEFVRTEQHQRFLRDMSAEERYREVLQNESYLLDRVPLNYLASYLQIAPETLSRIRKRISHN